MNLGTEHLVPTEGRCRWDDAVSNSDGKPAAQGRSKVTRPSSTALSPRARLVGEHLSCFPSSSFWPRAWAGEVVRTAEWARTGTDPALPVPRGHPVLWVHTGSVTSPHPAASFLPPLPLTAPGSHHVAPHHRPFARAVLAAISLGLHCWKIAGFFPFCASGSMVTSSEKCSLTPCAKQLPAFLLIVFS